MRVSGLVMNIGRQLIPRNRDRGVKERKGREVSEVDHVKMRGGWKLEAKLIHFSSSRREHEESLIQSLM